MPTGAEQNGRHGSRASFCLLSPAFLFSSHLPLSQHLSPPLSPPSISRALLVTPAFPSPSVRPSVLPSIHQSSVCPRLCLTGSWGLYFCPHYFLS